MSKVTVKRTKNQRGILIKVPPPVTAVAPPPLTGQTMEADYANWQRIAHQMATAATRNPLARRSQQGVKKRKEVKTDEG